MDLSLEQQVFDLGGVADRRLLHGPEKPWRSHSFTVLGPTPHRFAASRSRSPHAK